jgi:hypothetical protein
VRIGSSSDLQATASFFLPGTPRGSQEAEYGRLVATAGAETGCAPRTARIHRLGCRLAGRDCTIEVGCADPVGGAEVLAILDLGPMRPYGVFTVADRDALTMQVEKRAAYAVGRFQ